MELRLPMSVPVSLSSPDALYRTDTVGDLVVTLKGLLYSDESQAFALGLAINTPTGNDLNVSLPNSGTDGTNLTLDNNALHLIPFLALPSRSDGRFLFQRLPAVRYADQLQLGAGSQSGSRHHRQSQDHRPNVDVR